MNLWFVAAQRLQHVSNWHPYLIPLHYTLVVISLVHTLTCTLSLSPILYLLPLRCTTSTLLYFSDVLCVRVCTCVFAACVCACVCPYACTLVDGVHSSERVLQDGGDVDAQVSHLTHQLSLSRAEEQRLQGEVAQAERELADLQARLARSGGGSDGSDSHAVQSASGSSASEFESMFIREKPGPAGTVKAPRTYPPVLPDPSLNPQLHHALQQLLGRTQQAGVQAGSQPGVEGGEVLLAVACEAVGSLLAVWMAQVARLGLRNAVVAALDDASHDACTAHSAAAAAGASPSVACFRVQGQAFVQPLAAVAAASVGSDGRSSDAGAVVEAMAWAKWRVVRDCLALGVAVLVADVDVALLRDPFAAQPGSAAGLTRDCDVEGMATGTDAWSSYGYNDVKDDPNMGWGRYAHTMRVFDIDAGFVFLRPTSPALEALDRLVALYERPASAGDAANSVEGRMQTGVGASDGSLLSGGSRSSSRLPPSIVLLNSVFFLPSRPGYAGVHASRRVMDMNFFLSSKLVFKQLRSEGRLSALSPVAVHINFHRDRLARLNAVIAYFVDRDRHALDSLPDASA